MADLTVRERLLAAIQARLSDAGVTILRAPQPVIAATSDIQSMLAPESETVREARNGVATRELGVRFTTFARGETSHLVCDERVARIHEQLMSGWPGVLVEEIGSDFDEEEAEESVWRVVVRYRFIYRTSVHNLKEENPE